MAFHFPDKHSPGQVSDSLGIGLPQVEAGGYEEFLSVTAPAIRMLEQLPDLPPNVNNPRIRGYRPDPDLSPAMRDSSTQA